MREYFKEYSPRKDSMMLVARARSIIDDYTAQGYKLTLRQLYYQFVSKDLIPNTEKSYKKLGTIISRARLGGLLDWEAIEDRVRRPESPSEYADLDELFEAALYSYRLPRLQGQRTYVELWVEKDALAGILAPIARQYHVTLMVNRGYSSSSAMKESADRVRTKCVEYGCVRAQILYLGDLDPSGEDMVRDIRERLSDFLLGGYLVKKGEEGLEAETPEEQEARKPTIGLVVSKVALTMEQVNKYDPPPNPAKLTDPRATGFVAKYGNNSWEVDALPPPVLRELITGALGRLLDMGAMSAVRRQEERDKKRLSKALGMLSMEDDDDDDDDETEEGG